MGRKRRQHDKNVEENEESMGSGEGYKGLDCTHFMASININKLRKIVKDKKVNDTCTDCLKNGITLKDNDDELSNEPLELWICLQCGHIACGKNRINHAQKHYETLRTGLHYVFIDTYQWSVWCYKCEKNVAQRNPGYKKKILEITNILKEGKKLSKLSQPKPSIPLCQTEIISTDIEKKKVLNDLPKIGGLVNLGNTCFFNAVLQCLAQTPYLVQVLDDLQVPEQKIVMPGGKFKGSDDVEVELPPIEGVLEKTGNFTPVLRKTLSEMQNCDGQLYRPNELLNSLRKKTLQCTDGGQHDSHELLRHLLEQVRSEDLRRYNAIILEEFNTAEKSKCENEDDDLKIRHKFYANQANVKLLGSERVFRGELYSTLQCLECKHSSSSTEPFLDLSLPVVDKSFPPIFKTKNSELENSIDLIDSNTFSNSTKNDYKKTYKANNKKNKTNRIKNHENSNLSTSNSNRISEGKKGNVVDSEESDADIEDNIENEDISIPEIGESGYSSEKPSAVTSPVSPSEFRANDQNINTPDLNVLPILSNESSCNFDIDQSTYKNSTSPSPTDVSMIDITENKTTLTTELSLSTSLHSDFTSPEGRTIGLFSSPPTSKNTSTTSIYSNEDVLEKLDKLFSKSEINEPRELSDKECSLKTMDVDLEDDNSPDDKEDTPKKLTNGIADIMSSISKLDLSNSSELSTQYSTKEGECSIQSCLNQFTAIELMSENNKVGCVACTEKENKGKKEGVKMVCTNSTKKYRISRVPAVLILHLKRFQVQKFRFRKVGKHVSFPMILDLAPVSKDYTKPRIYALYGVVEHSGDLYGGHYVAYVKSRAPLKPNDPRWSFLPDKDSFSNKDTSGESNSELERDEIPVTQPTEIKSPPGQWYFISDSRVHEVDEKTVLNREAYLLFYERIL